MATELWRGFTPAARCPNCGITLDAAMNTTDDAGPEPGDPTICWYCGAFAVFTEHLALRPPTPAEIDEFTADPDVQIAMRARKEVRREHPWLADLGEQWPR